MGNYNDDARSVEWLEKTVARIHTDRLMVVGLEGEKFQKRLGVRPERLEEIDRQLQKRLLKARSRKADEETKTCADKMYKFHYNRARVPMSGTGTFRFLKSGGYEI